MNNIQDDKAPQSIGQISIITELIKRELFYSLKIKIIVAFTGLIFGISYWLLSAHKFESKITFVVEEGKSSLGGLAAIAGQFGLDLPGASVGGMLAGDNVMLFLRSEQLCKEVLESPYSNDKNITLARKYAETKGWIKKWNKKFPNQDFFIRNKNLQQINRIEDSLMHLIVSNIIKKDLAVAKPDKKSTFVEVNVEMQDENLSLLFSQRLVDLAIQKYVESRISIKRINVQKLQRRADSLLSILNERTFNSSRIQQPFIDANPAMKIDQVPVEISVRDKTIVSAIYIEVVKNLEFAKVSLSQETPAIQIVDNAWPPLEDKRVKPISSIFFGIIITFVIYSFYRVLTYFLKKSKLF